MDMDTYQDNAQRTKGSGIDTTHLLCSVLGLNGEAGEIADLYKKVYAHGHKMDQDKLVKELGDCLWYIADIAAREGWRLSEIAQVNVDKLKKRYPNGFAQERSINRVHNESML